MAKASRRAAAQAERSAADILGRLRCAPYAIPSAGQVGEALAAAATAGDWSGIALCVAALAVHVTARINSRQTKGKG